MKTSAHILGFLVGWPPWEGQTAALVQQMQCLKAMMHGRRGDG